MEFTNYEKHTIIRLVEMFAHHSHQQILDEISRVADEYSISLPESFRWTTDDLAELKKNYRKHGTEISALQPRHSADEIKKRAAYEQLTKEPDNSKNRFTSHEIEILRRDYPIYGSDISQLLDRHSKASICAKAAKLKIRKNNVV